jgi:hypothetical protein
MPSYSRANPLRLPGLKHWFGRPHSNRNEHTPSNVYSHRQLKDPMSGPFSKPMHGPRLERALLKRQNRMKEAAKPGHLDDSRKPVRQRLTMPHRA